MKALLTFLVSLSFFGGVQASSLKSRLDSLKKELSQARGEKRNRLVKEIAQLENKMAEKSFKNRSSADRK